MDYLSFSAKGRANPPPDAAKALAVPLTMLIRYLSIRMYQSKLSQAHASLESILDNTGIDIYVNDFCSHDMLYINKSMAAPYGGKEQFQGKKCWQVLYPGQTGPCESCPQKKLIDENGGPTKAYTWDYQRPFGGSWFRVFSAAFRWTDGRLAHVVSSADITDNKRKEASIGIACYPEDGSTAEELLRKADVSMYQAKKSGGGKFCFGYQVQSSPD